MAKLSKEELLKKIDESSMTDDEKISFMEDISDSIEVDNSELEQAKADLESARTELELLKSKYKERFLSNEEIAKVEDKVEDAIDEIDPELKEEEVIDVKDIFVEESSEDVIDEEKKEDEE